MTLFTISFAWLAYRHYTVAVGVFFSLLPTYLVRFSIGPIPSTLLEVMLLLLIIAGILRYNAQLLKTVKAVQQQTWLYYGTMLFLIGATVAVLTSVEIRAALGEWKAFYIEPISLTLVLMSVSQKESKLVKAIYIGLLISGLATVALVLYQGFSGNLIAEGYQGRATGWYGFPNGVGLFLGMLWGTVLYLRQSTKQFLLPSLFFLILTPLALYFSRSTGAIIAILATIGVLFLYHKKTRYPAIVVGITGVILLVSLPSLSPIKQELLLQDRSGQIRLHMWSEAIALIQDRPTLGAGLASYEERVAPYHTTVHGEGIEIFHHPHNLFLTIWVNTGLLGFVGFTALVIWMIHAAIKTKQPYLLATIIGMLVLGLVDSPYIKNDIAVVFWILTLFTYTELQNSKVNQIPSET